MARSPADIFFRKLRLAGISRPAVEALADRFAALENGGPSAVPDSWCDFLLTNGDVLTDTATDLLWDGGKIVGTDISLNPDNKTIVFHTDGLYVILINLGLDLDAAASGEVGLATGGTNNGDYGWNWTLTPRVLVRPAGGPFYLEHPFTFPPYSWKAGDTLDITAQRENWEAGTVTLDTQTVLHIRRIA